MLLLRILLVQQYLAICPAEAIPSVEATQQSIGFMHIFLQFFRQCKGNGSSCVWKAGSPYD
jgi:hypothetical protein